MTNQFKLFKGNGVLAGYEDTIQEAMSRCDAQHDWYFEKEGKLTKEERNYKVLRLCINKQLKRYGLIYDDVKKGGEYEFIKVGIVNKKRYFFNLFEKTEYNHINKPWYQYYTFESEQEFNEWEEFCIKLFRKELKMTKKAAETEFAWLDLNYGLKQNYEISER